MPMVSIVIPTHITCLQDLFSKSGAPCVSLVLVSRLGGQLKHAWPVSAPPIFSRLHLTAQQMEICFPGKNVQLSAAEKKYI